MANNDLTDIAVMANKRLNEESTQKLSIILGRDLYQTRSHIASKIPPIIFQLTDAQRIEEDFRTNRQPGTRVLFF